MSGLNIYDSSGNLVFDPSSLVFRLVGTVSTGGTNGSVSNAGLSKGTPWWLVLMNGGNDIAGFTASVFGNTLSWSYGVSDYTPVGTILYGVR